MKEPVAFDAELIDQCQLCDVPNLTKGLEDSQRHSWSSDRRTSLLKQIETSAAKTRARDERVKSFEFPDLPVSARLEEIQKAFEQSQVIIVSGETGSGKTTQLPKMALKAGKGRRGLIGHTQPRRIAARSVAERIADECQYQLGREVGYKVRFHDHTGPDTLVKLMTDGILLAEIKNDPQLRAYETLIIDEAHERSLNTDFLLGYLKWLLPKRPELKLIITSATIDTDRFANHFRAPVIEVSGRSYPVECRYRPLHDEVQGSMNLHLGIVEGVRELKREGSGDILVFLPGERDIRDAIDALRKAVDVAKDYDILALYGRLSAKEQARIFQTHSRRRIVLATNVAETSLTVPGIRYVIDSGLARIRRFSLRSKIQRLPIEPISQASAAQRAGRCGRLAPGICLRLYAEDDFERRKPFTEAEILRINLASVVLQMKSLNLGDIDRFPFLDPPEPKAIRGGIRLLQELNALDQSGRMTRVGKSMAKFPIEPRLARILVEADRRHSLTEACIVVAALSIQDPRERPAEKGQKADQAQAVFADQRSDFLSLIKLWQVYQLTKKQGSRSDLRRFSRDHFLSWLRMNEWEEVWRQVVRIASQELRLKLNHEPADYQALHSALIAGLLSHIGFRHEGKEYQGARNLRFHLFPGSGVFKKPPKWVLVAEQVETSRVFGRMVAAIEPGWVEACASHLVKRTYGEPHWSRKQGRAMVAERQNLFGLTLVQGRQVPLKPIDAALARELFIRCALVQQDFYTRAPFFSHNQQLLEAAGYLEHKQRRVDLVVDEQWLFEFYEQRIPPDVVDAQSFEQWRKQADSKDTQRLFLQKVDLLRAQPDSLPADDFPDFLSMEGLNLDLSYRFSPGAADDGVTIRIEMHQLNQLDPRRASWLIPGLLREKVIQLLRTLPKSVRKSLGPIPDVADRFMTASPNQFRFLVDELAGFVRAETGRKEQLQMTEMDIEPHLRMNVRLVKANQVVEESRDMVALINRYSEMASSRFAARLASPPLQLAGMTQWHGEGLPVFQVSTQAGEDMRVYLALSLEKAGQGADEKVVVSQFDAPAMARASHLQGLMGLLKRELRSEVKYLRKHLQAFGRLDLLLAQLPDHPWLSFSRPSPPLVESIIQSALETLFLTDGEQIRSQQDLLKTLTRKSDLIATCDDMAGLLEKILTTRAQLVSELSAGSWAANSTHDLQRHLDALVYAGFFQDTPMPRLAEYPRYLRAIKKRLERLLQNPGKDEGLVKDAQVFEDPFWTLKQKKAQDCEALAQIQHLEFRWLLEEYRIALFAQPMKTRLPISAKRMTKAWDAFRSND